MTHIIFYEKPGCQTNTRQKQVLTAAGHEVEARSLLTEPWTADRLQIFFASMPVASWFNPAAPSVKSGAVDPAMLDATAALALMLADPLLIKRPLLQIGSHHCAGFAAADLSAKLGLVLNGNPQGCSHSNTVEPCPP